MSANWLQTYKCVPCDRDITISNRDNREKTEFHLKNLRKKPCHKCASSDNGSPDNSFTFISLNPYWKTPSFLNLSLFGRYSINF